MKHGPLFVFKFPKGPNNPTSATPPSSPFPLPPRARWHISAPISVLTRDYCYTKSSPRKRNGTENLGAAKIGEIWFSSRGKAVPYKVPLVECSYRVWPISVAWISRNLRQHLETTTLLRTVIDAKKHSCKTTRHRETRVLDAVLLRRGPISSLNTIIVIKFDNFTTLDRRTRIRRRTRGRGLRVTILLPSGIELEYVNSF